MALIVRSGLEPPDLTNLPLDDPKTLDLFVRGDTDGVFQFESGGMKDILRQLKPQRLDDLIALNALYRPGPLDAKMIPEYIARAHGREEIIVPLKELEPILLETLGVIAYQEQVMRIAHKIAGFTSVRPIPCAGHLQEGREGHAGPARPVLQGVQRAEGGRQAAADLERSFFFFFFPT